MRVLPMGVSAALIDDPPGGPAAWSVAARALGLAGVTEIVPAVRTVLIDCESASALTAVIARLAEIETVPPSPMAERPTITIPVRYDGADLADVAGRIGLGVDDVIELHSSARYEVAFCGFAPGFGYLRGLPEVLHLPRRATPRTRVPAGSVAIASEFSAVYPSESPGGWHLLGHTELVLFDGHRQPPALLAPGTCVRFRPT